MAVVYPFGLPLCFVAGPALLIHTKRVLQDLNIRDYLHYSLTIILTLDTVVYTYLNPSQYQNSIYYVNAFEISNLSHSYILPRDFFLYAIPIHILIYSFSSLAILLRGKSFENLIPSISISVLGLVLLISNVILVDAFRVNDTFRLTLVLFQAGVLTILIYYVLNFIGQRTLPDANTNILLNTKLIQERKNFERIHSIIEKEYNNPNSILLETNVNKERFIKSFQDLPYTAWDKYFALNNLTFNHLKRQIRIERSRQLITEGYLKKYSVEALSMEVGYQSRTSFYNAFEQTVGHKFSTFRKTL